MRFAGPVGSFSGASGEAGEYRRRDFLCVHWSLFMIVDDAAIAALTSQKLRSLCRLHGAGLFWQIPQMFHQVLWSLESRFVVLLVLFLSNFCSVLMSCSERPLP